MSEIWEAGFNSVVVIVGLWTFVAVSSAYHEAFKNAGRKREAAIVFGIEIFSYAAIVGFGLNFIRLISPSF